MIFAICPSTVNYNNQPHYRFEVFDPYEGDYGVWSVLPDPPFDCPVTFDLVFSEESKVMLGTFQDGYFLYDLVKKEWFDCTPELWPTLSDAAPISHCIRGGGVDDDDGLIYWDSLNLNVVCYGPTTGRVFGEDATVDDLKSLLRDRGSYDEQLWLNLNYFAPENPVFTSLHYLGNLTFCYVVGAMGPIGKRLEIPKPSSVHMILFTVPPSDLQLSSREEEERKFTPQVVHVVELTCNGEEWMRKLLTPSILEEIREAVRQEELEKKKKIQRSFSNLV